MNIFSINCFENWKLCLSLHPQLSGYGEIGRHARLRIWCRKACRFESYYPHKKSFSFEKLFFIPVVLNYFSSIQALILFSSKANGITPDSNTFSWNFLMSNLAPILSSAFLRNSMIFNCPIL